MTELITKLVGIGLLAGVATGGCVATCAVTNSWKYGEGYRVGMVNKISKKGAIWETYEGQMALEGISGSGSSVGANTWDFAIDNYMPEEKQKELRDTLESCMNSGQKVKIHYVQQLSTFPWRSESNHLIQSIEPVGILGKGYESKRSESEASPVSPNGTAMTIDGKHYLFRHDSEGRLMISELTEAP